MLSRWPIRNKLLLGITLLLVIVLSLSTSSFQGTYAFREIVRGVSSRANELPLATALSKQISDLRVALADLDNAQQYSPPPPTANSCMPQPIRAIPCAARWRLPISTLSKGRGSSNAPPRSGAASSPGSRACAICPASARCTWPCAA